jgi:hypothetical protein
LNSHLRALYGRKNKEKATTATGGANKKATSLRRWPCPYLLFFLGSVLTHIPAMTVMMAGGFARRHRPATGNQTRRNNDEQNQDTFHVFQFGLLRIIRTLTDIKNYPFMDFIHRPCG